MTSIKRIIIFASGLEFPRIYNVQKFLLTSFILCAAMFSVFYPEKAFADPRPYNCAGACVWGQLVEPYENNGAVTANNPAEASTMCNTLIQGWGPAAGNPAWTCFAIAYEPGVCGTGPDTCDSGIYANVPDADGLRKWRCNGFGQNVLGQYMPSADCSLASNGPPAACGEANGREWSSAPHTPSALCGIGNTPSGVSGGSGPWNWTCTSGSQTVNCNASVCLPPIDGLCNNNVVNGCVAGRGDPIEISDNGTTDFWKCSGQHSGDPSGQCQKDRPVIAACDLSDEYRCTNGGTAINQSDNGGDRWTWNCTNPSGGDPSGECRINYPRTGQCDLSSHYRCEYGVTATNQSDNGGTAWTWNCPGTYGANPSGECRIDNTSTTYAWEVGDWALGQCASTPICEQDATQITANVAADCINAGYTRRIYQNAEEFGDACAGRPPGCVVANYQNGNPPLHRCRVWARPECTQYPEQ